MSAGINGTCSCSPWRMCGHHYARYLDTAPQRGMERESRIDRMQEQQAKALKRKRAKAGSPVAGDPR